MQKNNNKAFSVLEMLIVIMVLAIMVTIGFLSFTNNLVGTRNTSRLSALSSINEGLKIYSTKSHLPLPESNVEVRASGSILGYQGYVGKNIIEKIGYDKSGKDPKDKLYFTYYLTEDRKKFQLLTYLEKDDNVAFILPKVNALDYSNRYPTLRGEKLGLLTEKGTNSPIQEVDPIITDGYLDIVTTNDFFNAHFTNKSVVSGTGSKLKIIKDIFENPIKNCLTIKKSGRGDLDGIYNINPTGQKEFKVYCNMTTYDGGWTLVAFNRSDSTPFLDKDFMVKSVNANNIHEKDRKNYMASINPEQFSITQDTNDVMLYSFVYTYQFIVERGNGNWNYDYLDCVGLLGHTSRTAGCPTSNHLRNNNYSTNHKYNIANYKYKEHGILPYHTELCSTGKGNCDFEFYLR